MTTNETVKWDQGFSVIESYSGRWFAWSCFYCGRAGRACHFDSRAAADQAARKHWTACKARLRAEA